MADVCTIKKIICCLASLCKVNSLGIRKKDLILFPLLLKLSTFRNSF